MTISRLLAITVIFIGACFAWSLLGAALTHRSQSFGARLSQEVAENWGAPMKQGHPVIYYESSSGAKGRREVLPESSTITVTLDYDKKKKGLYWHRTYTADFQGRYVIKNTTPIAQTFYTQFQFPCEDTRYDHFSFRVGERDSTQDPSKHCGLTEATLLQPGEEVPIEIRYRAGGLDHWRYSFGERARVRDFELTMLTDFTEMNIPVGAQSPTDRESTADGWKLVWKYADLIHAGQSGVAVGMDMPKVLNPGPVAARMAFFAPVSLLFYFSVLIIMATLWEVRLHPMNYFFLAAGCFAFQLLFAYTVDLMPLGAAFALAASVSTILVSGYLWRATNARFAKLSVIAQLAFMTLFSYSFFFDGLTGITITIGAIITLALLMTVTAKVDWSTKFVRKPLMPEPLQERAVPPIPDSLD